MRTLRVIISPEVSPAPATTRTSETDSTAAVSLISALSSAQCKYLEQIFHRKSSMGDAF